MTVVPDFLDIICRTSVTVYQFRYVSTVYYDSRYAAYHMPARKAAIIHA